MRLKCEVKFQKVQPTSITDKDIAGKFCSIFQPFFRKRQLLSRTVFHKIVLVCIPHHSLCKIPKTPYAFSNRNEKRFLQRRHNSQIINIQFSPVVNLPSPRTPIKGDGIITVQKFSLFLSERTFQKLLREHNATKERLEGLKADVSFFRNNIYLKEKKTRTLMQNQLLKKLIPAMYGLERAKNIDLSRIKSKKLKRFIESFRENLQMVYNSFIAAMGLTAITPHIGDPFNEHYQTVVGIVYKKDKTPNSIVEVLKSGYSFNGEILSLSQVIISTNNPNHPNITAKKGQSAKHRLFSRLLKRWLN